MESYDIKLSKKVAKMVKRDPFVWNCDPETRDWTFTYTSVDPKEPWNVIVYTYVGDHNNRYSMRFYDNVSRISIETYYENIKRRVFRRIYDFDYAIRIVNDYNNQKEYKYFILNDIPYRVITYEEVKCPHNTYVGYSIEGIEALNLLTNYKETFEKDSLFRPDMNFNFTDNTNDIIIDLLRLKF